MTFFKKMSKRKNRVEAEHWFSELDKETQQDTAIKYLRSLDNKSLKNLYAAVDFYRQGDKILQDKVKDPAETEDTDTDNS